MSDAWNHKDIWTRRHEKFSVEVVRHGHIVDDNRWCVYLYVYANNPVFRQFNPDESAHNQPYFDCHSYVSYFKVYRDKEGSPTSYVLGWDYQHDGDHYEDVYTKDQACRMFGDAESLYNEMIERIHILESES